MSLVIQSKILSQFSVSNILEYQQFDLEVIETEKVKNYAAILSVSRAPDLSFGFVLEKSNDSADIPEDKNEEYWLGLTNVQIVWSRHRNKD